MATGGMRLPALEIKAPEMVTPLSLYRTGQADARRDEQDYNLSQVGERSKAGDYPGAADAAFKAGKPDLAMRIQAWPLERQAKFYDTLGRLSESANTPERWAALVENLRSMYGPEAVKGYEDFGARDQAMKLAISAKDRAVLAMREREMTSQERHRKAQLALREREIAGAEKYRDATLELQRSKLDMRDQAGKRDAAIRLYTSLAKARSPQEWDAIVQGNPGLLQTVGLGTTPRLGYGSRDLVLAQLRQGGGDPLEPTPEEAAVGITREAKAKAMRSKMLQGYYGDPGKGAYWDLDAQGRPSVGGKPQSSDAITRLSAARTALKNLDDIQRTLIGTIGQDGKPRGDGPSMLMMGVQNNRITGQTGEYGRAFRRMEASIMQLVYALSGKTVTNREREDFARIYMPQPWDSVETRWQKMQDVRGFFTEMMQAVQAGRPADYVGAKVRERLATRPEGTPPAGPRKPAPPQGGDRDRLFKKYGLD